MIYTLTCITASNGDIEFGRPIIHSPIMVIGNSVVEVIEKLKLKNDSFNYFRLEKCMVNSSFGRPLSWYIENNINERIIRSNKARWHYEEHLISGTKISVSIALQGHKDLEKPKETKEKTHIAIGNKRVLEFLD